jgi:RND family efflux transporter MFP subunit
MPVVRLSQNSLLRLIIQVPESAVARIHVGEPVSVTVQALNRTYEGKVARFDDKVNPETRTMETEVDVPNPKLELVPGMYAAASIAAEQSHDVLIAPVQAIVRTNDKTTAWVVGRDGRLEPHEIAVGLEAPDRVEVRSGLREHDLVVVGGRAQLKPGTIVTPKIVDRSSPTEGAR